MLSTIFMLQMSPEDSTLSPTKLTLMLSDTTPALVVVVSPWQHQFWVVSFAV